MQISGMNFVFDSSKEPDSRIVSTTMWKTGEPIVPEELYVFATKTFIASGKDGYNCLVEDPDIVWYSDPDASIKISDIVFSAMERFASDFKVDHKRADIRKRRLELLNTSEDNISEETGYIKIAPKLTGRITNL